MVLAETLTAELASQISVTTIYNDTVALDEEFSAWADFDPVKHGWRADQVEDWQTSYPAPVVDSMPEAVGLELERARLDIPPAAWRGYSNEDKAGVIAAGRVNNMVDYVSRAQQDYRRIKKKAAPKPGRSRHGR